MTARRRPLPGSTEWHLRRRARRLSVRLTWCGLTVATLAGAALVVLG